MCRLWNYNKGGSEEHLLRGCKEALLSVDGQPLKRCLLRMVSPITVLPLPLPLPLTWPLPYSIYRIP